MNMGACSRLPLNIDKTAVTAPKLAAIGATMETCPTLRPW